MRSWLEWLLGIEAAVAGEGTDWSITAPLAWAPSVLLIFIVAVVALVIGVYLREGPAARKWKFGLAACRLAIIALVLLMIFELQLSVERTGLPRVAVLLDVSASMGENDRYDDTGRQQELAARLKAVDLTEPNRLNLAKSLLLADQGALLEKLRADHKLEVFYVSSGVERPNLPAPTEADEPAKNEFPALLESIRSQAPLGQQSRLGKAVRDVLNELRGTPPSAFVLLTDGITTDGETLSQAAIYARRRGVPLFLIGLGSEQPKQDLALGELLVDEVVFVDDLVNFEFRVTATGMAGQSVEAVLREQNKPEILARQTITLGPDQQPQSGRITYRPTQVGEFEYVVEIAPRPQETNPDNNRRSRRVSVRKEQIKVLLVDSAPRFEFRYLKALLERDNTIQLKTVLQGADPNWAELDKSALRPNLFPVSREQLFEYHVIIFGDVNPSFLSTATVKNLVDFVKEQGGGLILASGTQYNPMAYRETPLADLIPVELDGAVAPPLDNPLRQGFRPRITDFGLSSPPLQIGDDLAETQKIWQNLPELYWVLSPKRIKPAARVLAEHPTQTTTDGRAVPVLALQYSGQGLVLYHGTDDTWRWRGGVGDVYFARYWIQAIRYLSRAKLLGRQQLVEITADRETYRLGESVQLQVRFPEGETPPDSASDVSVVVEKSSGKHRLALSRQPNSRNVFEGRITPTADGTYHAWLAVPLVGERPPSVDFTVVAPPSERERVQMDRADMQRAADETGGRFYTFETAGNLLSQLPPGRRVPVESRPPQPLWNRWPMLLLFLGLLLAEWLLRKRCGML